jgi:ribose-phosphate pyrophosphokinase
MDRGKLTLLSCEAGRPFALRVADSLRRILEEEGEGDRFELARSAEVWFAVGEVKAIIDENVRGHDVYVVQTVVAPEGPRTVNDNLMACCTMVDAARESDADSITAVLPAFPYARQDRRKAREGITARLVVEMLEAAGAHRVICIDIHAEAIAGFFRQARLENLHASRILMEHFRHAYQPSDLVVVAPDIGSAGRARFFSKELGTDLALIDKARSYRRIHSIESMRLVGSVRGKVALVPDDMIDTGGTLIRACELLHEKGAREIYLATALPFFSASAEERFDEAYRKGLFRKLIGTDTVPRGPQFGAEHPWYDEVSVAPLVARVIFNINRKRSVSELLR